MSAKKVVLMLEIHDNKDRQKALKAVSNIPGLDSLAMDMKDKKLTVIGDIDPVQVVDRLRKHWHTEIVTVGPAKDGKNNDNNCQNDCPKKETEKLLELWKQHCLNSIYSNTYGHPCNYCTTQHRCYSAEENPNSCVIF